MKWPGVLINRTARFYSKQGRAYVEWICCA